MRYLVNSEQVISDIIDETSEKTGSSSITIKNVSSAINDLQINGANYINVSLSQEQGDFEYWTGAGLQYLSSAKTNELKSILNAGNIPEVTIVDEQYIFKFLVIGTAYLNSKNNVGYGIYTEGNVFFGISTYYEEYQDSYTSLIILTDGELTST